MKKNLPGDDRAFLLVIDAKGDATDLLRIVEALEAMPRAVASPGPVDDRARLALEGLSRQAHQVLDDLEGPGDPAARIDHAIRDLRTLVATLELLGLYVDLAVP